MNELHRNRSLANSGSYPFYGTMSHIAHRENPGNIGFEQERIAVERPSLGALPVTYKVRPSQQETAFVSLEDIRQPIGSRQCSNKDEHRTRRHALNLVGVGAQNRNVFEMCPRVRVGR